MTPTAATGVIAGGGIPAAKAEAGVVLPGRRVPGLGVFMDPGVMGAGLYLVWPAFYTDVTDSYRLGRAGRLRTDLGGLYFNAIVVVATKSTAA